jgi:hypothetical protein
VLDLSDTRLTFTATNALLAGSQYRVDVVGFRDVAGNSLASNATTFFNTVLAPGTGDLPTGASVAINPPEMFADGVLPAIVEVSNINRNNTLVPNGSRIGITAQPVFRSSVGGTVSGDSVGTSPDTRFLVFETFGGKVTINLTPPDLRWLAPNQTSVSSLQVVSLDAEDHPVGLIGERGLTLYGTRTVAISSNDPDVTDNQLDLLAVVRDLRDRLVTDGTPIGAKVVTPNTDTPVVWGALNGGSASAADANIRIYTTTGGQTAVGFAGPAAQQCRLGPVSGTKPNLNLGTLKVFTIDTGGRELYPITTATIECFDR